MASILKDRGGGGRSSGVKTATASASRALAPKLFPHSEADTGLCRSVTVGQVSHEEMRQHGPAANSGAPP